MEEDRTIPYFVHEGSMARMERTIKRLWIALLVAILLMFSTNALWLYSWMQYDYVSETVTNDAITVDGKRGNANYIGGDGTINGEDNSKENSDKASLKDSQKWAK